MGPIVVRVLVGVNVAAWLAFPPPDDGRGAFLRQVAGEVLSTTAVVVLAVALLLSTRLGWLEPAFGGLDKMYRAHREVGVTGFALLVAHVAVVPWRLDSPGGVPSGLIAFVGITVLVVASVGPRWPLTRRFVTVGYRWWRRTHRFIGLFFIFSLAHMFLVRPLVTTTPVPLTLVLTAYVVGIVSYLYVLLLARFVRPTRRYTVVAADRLTDTTVEVVLAPVNKPIVHRSGQFVFVRFAGRILREPHPFTVASSPRETTLRLVIKANGDFTRHLHDHLQPGQVAKVEGAYGMLDHRRGGLHQVWIAGGIGITPFLSWIRDLDDLRGRVDFFYTVRNPGDALYISDITDRARDLHPDLVFHLNISSQDGTLTLDRVAATVPGDLAQKTYFLCGPVGMITAFEAALHDHGVPDHAIHYEEFSFR